MDFADIPHGTTTFAQFFVCSVTQWEMGLMGAKRRGNEWVLPQGAGSVWKQTKLD